MKIKLETVRDVSILIASGPIEPSNFAILRAGVRKLLSDGKNKIILELPDSSQLSTPILRELAHLNLLANELAGQILLSSIAPLTRAKIEAFSKPPVVRCFASRGEALAVLQPAEEIPSIPKAAESPAATPKAEARPAPVPSRQANAPDEATSKDLSPSALAEAAAEEAADAPSPDRSDEDKDLIKQLRAELREKELAENADLRKRATDLERENKILKLQLAKLVLARKEPPEMEAWKEQILRLERELADAIQTAQTQSARGPGSQAAQAAAAAALKKSGG
jgi:hypothetical protein